MKPLEAQMTDLGEHRRSGIAVPAPAPRPAPAPQPTPATPDPAKQGAATDTRGLDERMVV